MIQTAEIRENLKIPLPSVIRRVMTLENENVVWYQHGRSLAISADTLPGEEFPDHDLLDITTIMDGRYVRPPTKKLDDDILQEFSSQGRTLEDVLSRSMLERSSAEELHDLLEGDTGVELGGSGQQIGDLLPDEFAGLLDEEVDNVVVFFLLEEQLLKGNRVAYLVTQNTSTLMMRQLIG